MTQEHDSTVSSGNTPDTLAAPAEQTGPAAKKTRARKTTSPKTAPAAHAAIAAGEENTPAKKPRAAAKRVAGTPARGAKTPAKTAKPATGDTDGETAKAPAKKPAAKPKTAALPAAALPVADGAAPPPAQGEASPAQAAAPKRAKPRRAASPAKDGKNAAGPVMEKPAEVAAREHPETTRGNPPQVPAPVPALSGGPDTAEPDHAPEKGGAPEVPAKPASRRSRRGGRRRNKSRAAAAAAEKGLDSPEAAGPAREEDTPAPAPARDASVQTPVTEPAKTSGDAPAETPAQTPVENRTGGSAKSAPKTAAKEKKPQPRTETKGQGGKRKMFISVLSGELVEVVLAEEGVVFEYYVEMQHQAKVKGNIYKGVVSNIDANLQAAFVSYAGGVRNGFLQIDEVHPEYYVSHNDPAKGRKYPPIQKVLQPGQEILVQVVKEPSGTKGAFLTSYLSLPGRFLVLTPGREQIGVSRKVENDEERARLRGLLEGLKPGAGLGVIVRTASTGAVKTSLQRDLQFLKRLWKDVRAKGQTAPAPGLIYEELDLSTRAVRDYLTEDVQEVWVDDVATADQVTELASLLFPKKQDLVHLHHDNGQTLFERFSLQKQLAQIHSREVSLPSGGSLVIDKTEALTAIDINSGRSGGKTNFEDMAYRTNLEAAQAIPLQLRLRDIGGQIVADFIEMRDREHWREVEKAVRNGMKGDRARYDVGKIGPFGMLEIVRQRLGSSAISISTEACPCCNGTGIRRNLEWQAMQALRDIGKQLRQAAASNQAAVTCRLETELAFYLLNAKRAILQSLESDSGVALTLAPKTE